jgi:hypothetical protein
MPTPLALTEAQLAALMMLAKPLQPKYRNTFMRTLAYVLCDRRDVGDGELHRLASEVIRATQ